MNEQTQGGAVRLCGAPHPTLRYETGHKVRCSKPRGHAAEGDYSHFDSFAMRSWEQDEARNAEGGAGDTRPAWVRRAQGDGAGALPVKEYR
jgi:hypothetical protein